MSWLRKTNKPEKRLGAIIAIESVSSEITQTLLSSIERELATAGFAVSVLELPTKQAERNIPAVFEFPDLLDNNEVIGFVAGLDKCVELKTLTARVQEGEIVLLTGSRLAVAAWLATEVDEYNNRVILYRWLERIDQALLKVPKIDLSIYVDVLPEHVSDIEHVSAPAGWLHRKMPRIAGLRDSFLEAAQLTAAVKLVLAHKNGKLMPDGEIHNRVWNLVRRIALKTNLPPA